MLYCTVRLTMEPFLSSLSTCMQYFTETMPRSHMSFFLQEQINILTVLHSQACKMRTFRLPQVEKLANNVQDLIDCPCPTTPVRVLVVTEQIKAFWTSMKEAALFCIFLWDVAFIIYRGMLAASCVSSCQVFSDSLSDMDTFVLETHLLSHGTTVKLPATSETRVGQINLVAFMFAQPMTCLLVFIGPHPLWSWRTLIYSTHLFIVLIIISVRLYDSDSLLGWVMQENKFAFIILAPTVHNVLSCMFCAPLIHPSNLMVFLLQRVFLFVCFVFFTSRAKKSLRGRQKERQGERESLTSHTDGRKKTENCAKPRHFCRPWPCASRCWTLC